MTDRSGGRRTRRSRAAFLGGGVLALAAAAVLGFAGSGSASAQDAPKNVSSPTISGTPQQGQALKANPGLWDQGSVTFTYQWRRCDSGGGSCGDISGATARKYTLGSADVGHTIAVRVFATNSNGTGTADSAPTAVIQSASAPANTSPPTISGTAQVGQTLTATTGTWSGTTPMTFAYAWLRCDANGNNCSTVGTNSQTFVIGSGNVDHRLRVSVTAKNAIGSATATSVPTAVVVAAGVAPQNTSLPAISGTAQDGQTLLVTSGTWTGTAPITFAYQWVRCDANGANCAAISGATGTSYKAATADVGHRLEATVQAKNAYGSKTVTTAATAAVTSALPPGAIKLANGTISIPITSVSLPDRLMIDKVSFSPSTIRSRTEPFVGRFHVVDSNGYVVRDALVYAIGVPPNRVSVPPETQTDQSGWATISYTVMRGLPFVRGAQLAIFVRARKPGENLLGGVSTRRLVSIRVQPA